MALELQVNTGVARSSIDAIENSLANLKVALDSVGQSAGLDAVIAQLQGFVGVDPEAVASITQVAAALNGLNAAALTDVAAAAELLSSVNLTATAAGFTEVANALRSISVPPGIAALVNEFAGVSTAASAAAAGIGTFNAAAFATAAAAAELDLAAGAMKGLEASATAATIPIASVHTSTSAAGAAGAAAAGGLNQAGTAARNLGAGAQTAGTATRGLGAAATAAQAGWAGFSGAVNSANTTLHNMTGTLSTIVPLIAAMTFAHIIGGASELAAKLQTLSSTINGFYGSTTLGAQAIGFLQTEAARTGIAIDSLSDGFRKWISVAATSGGTVGDAEKSFSALTTILAATGTTSQNANRLFQELAEGVSKGSLNMQQFNAIGREVPGLMQKLEQQIGENATTMEKATKSTADLTAANDNSTDAWLATANAATTAAGGINGLRTAHSQTVSVVAGASGVHARVSSSIRDSGTSASGAGGHVRSLGGAHTSAAAAAETHARASDNASTAIGGTTGKAQAATLTFGKLSDALVEIAGQYVGPLLQAQLAAQITFGRLEAAATNAQLAFGQAFNAAILPAVRNLTAALNNPAFDAFATTMGNIAGAVSGVFLNAITAITNVINGITTGVYDLGIAIATVFGGKTVTAVESWASYLASAASSVTSLTGVVSVGAVMLGVYAASLIASGAAALYAAGASGLGALSRGITATIGLIGTFVSGVYTMGAALISAASSAISFVSNLSNISAAASSAWSSLTSLASAAAAAAVRMYTLATAFIAANLPLIAVTASVATLVGGFVYFSGGVDKAISSILRFVAGIVNMLSYVGLATDGMKTFAANLEAMSVDFDTGAASVTDMLSPVQSFIDKVTQAIPQVSALSDDLQKLALGSDQATTSQNALANAINSVSSATTAAGSADNTLNGILTSLDQETQSATAAQNGLTGALASQAQQATATAGADQQLAAAAAAASSASAAAAGGGGGGDTSPGGADYTPLNDNPWNLNSSQVSSDLDNMSTYLSQWSNTTVHMGVAGGAAVGGGGGGAAGGGGGAGPKLVIKTGDISTFASGGLSNDAQKPFTTNDGGFPVIVHPNEAIVPLSNGSIPIAVNASNSAGSAVTSAASAASDVTSSTGLPEAISALGLAIGSLASSSSNAVQSLGNSVTILSSSVSAKQQAALSSVPAQSVSPSVVAPAAPTVPSAPNVAPSGGSSGHVINIQMTVNAKDADSFRASQDSMLQDLNANIQRALQNVGTTSVVDDPTVRPSTGGQ